MLWESVYIGSQVVLSSIVGLCHPWPTKESGGTTRHRVTESLRDIKGNRQTKTGLSKQKDTSKPSPGLEKTTGLGILLALEPRIMFDGAALATGAEVVQDQVTQEQTSTDQDLQGTDDDPFTNNSDLLSALSSVTAPSDRKEIVFIDTSVEGYQTLLEGIEPSAEAILLDPTRDGMEQIAEILRERSDIDAIHIISHGNQGELRLGTGILNLASMQGEYADELAIINEALTDEADFLIYGCNFGEGESGREAATLLAELTGTDVAASVDDTGSAQYGADWDLEYQTGIIETQIAVSAEAQENWVGKLAIITVDTFSDVIDGGDGLTSLREAVIAANAGGGGDTINLAAGTYTLSIGGTGEDAAATGDLDILMSVTITGAGAGTTIIDANGIDRAFHLRGAGGSTVTISGITIQNGDQSNGGGIFVGNGRTLNLSDSILTGNNHSGAGSGGAIHVHGTANLDRVLMFGNTASVGGAIGFHGADGGSLTNVTISGNTSTGNAGGLWTDSAITIKNSTITLNHGNNGGGIFANGTTVTISNTIVSDNTANSANKDVAGSFNSDGFNLVKVDNGDFGGDITGVSANLGALADNGGTTQTHALLGGSLAINAGTATGAPAIDQRSFSRDASIDIGAFEFGAVPSAFIVDTTNDLVDGDTSSVTALLSDKGADGFISLREAILAVNQGAGGEAIVVQTGTYTLSIGGTGENSAATGDLDFLKDMTIIGDSAAGTIIDGGAIDRVFEVRSGSTVTMSNMTIQNGNTSSNGAGIDINSGNLTLSNVIVSGNTSTGAGGGISNSGTLSLIDTAISGNSAVWGGGINNDSSNSLTLERVTIDANMSTNNGGGIYNFGGTGVSLTNVTISGNTSGGNGGGIWTNRSINITNSTIASNLGGGGIHAQGGPGDAVLKNTILNNNVGGNANKALTSLGNNIDSGNTAGLAGPGDQINTNPLLGALADNGGPTRTHALLGGPAVNAGTAAGAPALDQRGVTRDGSVDIGAYEFTGNITPTVDLDMDNSGAPGNDFALTFIEGDGPTAIADGDTDLVDADSIAFDHVTLSISALLDGNAEVLVLDGSTFALATAVAGQNTMGGLYHVVITTGGGTATVTITKQGGGTFDEIETETLIMAIQYQHTDTSHPTDGDRLIDVTVNDGTQDSVAARSTINVDPVNDPPLAVADGFTVNEGSTNILNLANNDSDVDDGLDLTSITIIAGPTNGTIDSINADGTVTYTHNGSETLVDSFTYTIDDLSGVTSNTVTVSLTVTPQNDPPVAVANGFTINEGSTNTLDLAGNDTDADDGLDLSSITIVAGPTNGTIDSINAGGTVTYTHNGSETLADSFTYTIRDLAGATSNTVTVSLTVTPQNDAPIIISDGGGASASLSVLTGNTAVTAVNATDGEGTPLTYSIIGGADAALFSIDPTTGALTFNTAPDVLVPNDVGGDNVYDVIVGATDGTASDTQAIAVTVTDVPVVVLPPPPDPPSDSDSPSEDEGDTGESEEEASGNVVNTATSSHGSVSTGSEGSAAKNAKDSNLTKNSGEDDLAAIQQRAESQGMVSAVSDLLNLLQKPYDSLTFQTEIQSLLSKSGFLQDLDRVRDEFQGIADTEKVYLASSIAASSGLSIGYVIWLLRSGVLLTALLSSVPAWQFVNPLLILDAPTPKTHGKGQEDLEDDSVEAMFENHTVPEEASETKTEDMAKTDTSRWTRHTSQ